MTKAVKIGKSVVGAGHPCFVVAEIGINHNGDLEIAKKLIDVAADTGCDAVKFQKRTVEVVYTPKELATSRQFDAGILRSGMDRLPEENRRRLAQDASQTTNGDQKYCLEFGEAEYSAIDAHCRDRGLMWFASPWDEGSVDFLEGFDPPCHKIASASLTDGGLLRHIRSTGRPVILSTGMSSMGEIERAVEILGTDGLILMHTVSTYPAKTEDLNLRVIQTLARRFVDVPIGYSGHEHGTTRSVCAVALGACTVERHITLDRAMPGSDQAASLEPAGLKLMVDNIRLLESALGDGVKRVIPAEEPIKQKLRRK